MSTYNPIEILKSIPIFSQFTSDELHRLLLTVKERRFQANDFIIKKGDTGVTGFYIMLSGNVEVRMDGKAIAKRGPREYFGEIALLAENPPVRTADVIALEESLCLVIPKWDFRSLMRNHPDMAMKVMSELVMRMQDTKNTSL
ncbi:cyclic nucleotide-binding domain-containing protein [Candidatus Acetothermia bacterium]|nr:cyclic nucleotide-binding domain-containing protein [Candidatus Acetothermia bacterium]MBI3642624.1 cyclic nucleotide-binding domain-containing protein [Candidatus Acetothermia bacterium]